MNQTTIKTPNPKGSLFLKIDLRDLAAGVYLSAAPSPLLHTVYLLTQGKGGGSTSEKVRGALVHKRGRKYQQD